MNNELSTINNHPRQAWPRMFACLILFGLAGGLPLVPVDLVVPAVQAQSIPAAVRRAQSLLQRGLADQAIAAFQQALRSNPNSLEAKLGLAQAYQKAGKDAEAWSAYQRVLEQAPNNIPALKAVGILGGYRPEWQLPGIEALNTLLNLQPNDNEARAQRALLLGFQGRYPESFADYDVALANNPSPDTLLGAAKIYTYSGDYQRGLEFFRRYQATGKQITDYGAAAYAIALRKTGSTAQSIQILEQELKKTKRLDGLAIELRSELAQSYSANGQLDQALATLEPLRGRQEAALPLARALTGIGREQRRTDLYREGVEIYQQVLASTPQPSPALVREVADVLSEVPSERAQALALYQQVTAAQPNNKSLLLKQLILENQLGQISQADFRQRLLSEFQPLPENEADQRALAQALVPLDPPDPELLPIYQDLLASGINEPFLNFRIAQMYLQRNQIAEAKQALAAYQATAVGADDLSSELLLAEIDRREGNLEASAQRYESIINRNASDSILTSALRGLAGIRVAQGRAEDAIAIYDQLLQRNPNDLLVKLGRASLAYQAERMSQTEAEAVLNEWLQARPNEAPPELFSLVGVLPASAQREALYNALLAIEPDNVAVQLRRLQVIAQRDPAAAKEEVAKLIARNPENIGAYFVQGELATALKDYELAIASYQEILKREPNNTGALLALGGVRFTQQKLAEARAIYKRVLEIEPKNLIARRNLAELNVADDYRFTALDQFKDINAEQQAESGQTNPELDTRIQQVEVDILKRRGFQPPWERY
jgi:tetratricopeptide (TPR) repeat protein